MVSAAERELRMHDGVLQRDDQAVATEQCDKPWQASGRDELDMVGPLKRQPQGRHIVNGLGEGGCEGVVAGLDL